MVEGSGRLAHKPAIDARTAAASLFPPIRPRLGQALCALLFAVVVSSPGHAHENAPGMPPVHPEITSALAGFDTLFWDIDDGKFSLADYHNFLTRNVFYLTLGLFFTLTLYPVVRGAALLEGLGATYHWIAEQQVATARP